MSCYDKNCNKDIHYCVGPLNGDEDFGTLTASDGIYASKIYDACGNLRIDLGCSDCDGGQDCGDIVRDCSGEEITVVALIEKATGSVIPFVGCDQINAIKRAGNAACWKVQTIDGQRYNLNSITCCKRVCQDLPTTIEGGLVVNGDIEADTIYANEFVGNGCGVTNTDNQEVEHFYHDVTNDLLVLTTVNTKDCPDMPDTHKIWSIDTKPFTHNTYNETFEFEPDDQSDILCITDSDGNKVCVDLEKYNNKQETYIVDGNCSNDGIITLDYNRDSPLYPQQVVIDISNAIHTIESAEYDPCTGEMLLCHDNGECVLMDNLPINVDAKGEIPLNPEWTGKVYYHIRSNVIMVSVNVELSGFTHFPPGNYMPYTLGKLPVKLWDPEPTNIAVDTYTYKYLVSHSAKSAGFINHVQLGITTDGVMKVTQWAIPERIQDSFCLVIESIDKSVTSTLCPEPIVPLVTKIRYHSNTNSNEVIEVIVTGNKYLIQQNTFIYAHWDFLLWNTMPDRSGNSFKPNYYIKLDGTDIDLYAQWKQVIFVVTYDSNNGTGEIRSFEFYPGVAILNNMFPRPINTTFTFAEWNTEFDGSGVQYLPGNLLYVKYDITLYAIWR